MEVPEELKRFNHMTDKEQQEHAEEIAETIEKLMREEKLPYYRKRKWTKEKEEVNSVDNLTVRALSEEVKKRSFWQNIVTSNKIALLHGWITQ